MISLCPVPLVSVSAPLETRSCPVGGCWSMCQERWGTVPKLRATMRNSQTWVSSRGSSGGVVDAWIVTVPLGSGSVASAVAELAAVRASSPVSAAAASSLRVGVLSECRTLLLGGAGTGSHVVCGRSVT